MDGLNFPFATYIPVVAELMDLPIDSVLADLRSSGLTTNPLDPEKPLS